MSPRDSRNAPRSLDAERGTSDDQDILAVLIDADNARPSVIEGLLAEIAKYGVASVRRIYGDFTSTRMTQWKQALLKHSIQPVQQFAYTSGKNATDSSLIIDAMDLMYTRRFGGFCLVSSDSDFTRLAQRLREEGLMVYGFGERKTPDPFVQACDKFIYTELLRADAPNAPDPLEDSRPRAPRGGGSGRSARSAPPAKRAEDAAPVAPPATRVVPAAGKVAVPFALIEQAIEDALEDNGWAFLGNVGSYLTKVRPDFDTRLYGYRKLSDLIKAHPARFEVEERGATASGRSIFVRAVVART